MVIERNRIQNQLIDERLPCPQQGLRTARALGVVQVYHGRAAGHGQRPRDLFGESGPHAHRHGDHATEFQEISAGYSLPFQPSLDILFSQTNGNTHTLLLIQRPARCRSHAWIKMVGTPPASPSGVSSVKTTKPGRCPHACGRNAAHCRARPQVRAPRQAFSPSGRTMPPSSTSEQPSIRVFERYGNDRAVSIGFSKNRNVKKSA